VGIGANKESASRSYLMRWVPEIIVSLNTIK